MGRNEWQRDLLACVAHSLASDGGRDVAIDLLAADALLTHACEAAAEAGPEALERLLDAVSPASLAQDLLEDQP